MDSPRRLDPPAQPVLQFLTQEVLALLPEFLVLMDAQERIVWVNRVAAEHGPETPIGKHVIEYIVPELREQYRAAIRRAIETGTPQEIDSAWDPPGGAPRIWFSASVTPIRGGDLHGHLMLVARDVTRRLRLEEALRDAEAQFRVHFNSHPLPSLILRIEGNELVVRDFNTAAIPFSKGRVCDLIGMKASELWAHDPSILDAMRRCAVEHLGMRQITDYRMRTTGETRRLCICLAFVPPHSVVAFAEDLTEQQHTIEALRQSEARARSFFDAAIDPLWDLDLVNGSVVASPSQYRLLGYEPGEIELSLERYLSHIHPDDLPGLQAEFDRCVRGEKAHYQSEHRLRTRDGRWRRIVARAVVVGRDAEGRARRMVGYDRDVTAEREAQEQAQRILTEHDHLARLSSLGEMAAGIAHEVNQPLVAIINYAESARRRLEHGTCAPDDLARRLAEISRMAQRAGDVIRRLRAVVGRRASQPVRVDLNAVIAETIGLVESEARAAGAHIEAALAPQGGPAMVDALQIQLVLLNLLRNAIQAMVDTPAGQRRVFVRSERLGATVRVSVTDNGRGLTEAQLARVFEPFFTTRDDGMGIGLSLARTIIESHSGRIGAEPRDGPGAVFWFTLPLAGAQIDPGVA